MSPLPLYLAPFLIVALLMLRRGFSLLHAGLAGLAATLPGMFHALEGDPLGFMLDESARGAWIAWQAIAVIVAGLFFHGVVAATRGTGGERETDGAFSHRALYTICFLLGPFFETTVGFGMGIVITLPLLLRLGLQPVAAVTFSLFSQILVPWGALGVGTVVGAELAGITLAEMGVRSALLSAPLLIAYLLVFWLFMRREGLRPQPGQMMDDLLWTGALDATLYLATRYAAVETGTMVATGALLCLRYLRDEGRGRGFDRKVLAAAAPYALLTVTLLATRAVPAVAGPLREALAIQPGAGYPVFRVFHHVSFWLLVVAILYGGACRLTRDQWRLAASATWRRGRIPVAVTLVFVVMAQWISASGMAGALAASWADMAGSWSVLATPVFAAIAGFLTSSNIGSNAMVMPIQGALAMKSQLDPGWIAALQNTTGSNLTMLSAARVAMGCSLIGLAGRERDVYQRAFPLGIAALTVMIVATCLLMPGSA